MPSARRLRGPGEGNSRAWSASVSDMSARNGQGRGRPRYPDVLTPAEWRTVDAVRHGMSTRQIARRRGISPDAVKFHVANALAKLGLTTRADLRRWPGVPAGSALGAYDTRGISGMSVPSPESASAPGSPDPGFRLGPLGQIARSVSDVARAEAWYRDVLGLPHLYTFGDLAFFDCGGVRLYLGLGAADVEPSVLYFRVADIQAAYSELTARGVVFRGAPHMIHKHASGAEEWMAFFDDPDGHPLALMCQVGPLA
jgi:DNA-binding CsgD family transcriptional regulator/catechol 2,3-dioxygenase-like lactoylglutathione lyase family enzyme